MSRIDNIGFLCTDWQIEQGRGQKIALRWISSALEQKEYSFQELTHLSNKAANVLLRQGLVKGDRIMILLPKIPELFFYFLGALKLGLNCCILFSNLGEDALSERISDTGSRAIISNASFSFRLNRILPKINAEFKLYMIDDVKQTGSINGIKDEFINASEEFETPHTSLGQYSHFHFTSGSTGKPKGVQHIHGAVVDHKNSFMEVMQPESDDIYWCTADPGWVTGVSYGIIAPWVSGITQIQLEGNFNAELWMSIIEKQQVNILYTAPTVFRMLMQKDDDFYSKFNYSSIKRIYCVGEPLNPVIISWGRRIFNCEIYDTWFQTETGSMMITNRPGIEVHPGSMGKPLSYINASILDEGGNELQPGEQGLLCLKKNWASMFTEYINNPETYNKKFLSNYYLSGDIAQKDVEGYIWFIGRNDDVINTAGHLVSPFEVESALFELPNVKDAAVVGVPDNLLFEKVVAFVVTRNPENLREQELKIKLFVASKVSSIAAPQEVIFVESIPKTKSGKIMRRVLKKQYLKEDIGDVSTLEEV